MPPRNVVNPSIQKFIVLPTFVAVRKNAISLIYFAHSDFRLRSFSPPRVWMILLSESSICGGYYH
jgi:hypothetical protein